METDLRNQNLESSTVTNVQTIAQQANAHTRIKLHQYSTVQCGGNRALEGRWAACSHTWLPTPFERDRTELTACLPAGLLFVTIVTLGGEIPKTRHDLTAQCKPQTRTRKIL